MASCEHIPSFVFHESRVTQLLCVHERARRRSDAVTLFWACSRGGWVAAVQSGCTHQDRARSGTTKGTDENGGLGRTDPVRSCVNVFEYENGDVNDDISASPWVRLCATETKWREERRKVANLACRINLHCPARPLQSAHTSQIPLPVDSTTVSLSSSRTTAVTKRLLSEKNNNKKNKLTVPRGAREDEKFLIWTRSLKEEKY